MCHTVHRQYQGWDIHIRCTKRPPGSQQSRAASYAAEAEAELQPNENPAEWVDPRVQIVTTGTRVFRCDTACVEQLFSEVKELIDALRK